ncbi:MAG TPA: dienelactone hydrolase family protein [Candidatus Nanoarchaeia archaeon]|nr:dienelactone hydrolase family protein [Candidatus Nanoarchaeia archaeon]
MKYALLPILFILVLSACQGEPETCPAGDIGAAGDCAPAPSGNPALLGQDLPDVDGQDIIIEGARGFVAAPRQPGEYPGVIMIHEWWGLNDNIKEMAKILAKEGYTVFAIDLYDGEVAADSAKARELSSRVRSNPEGAIASMQAAARYLREERQAEKLASLGWCFGGGQSLQLALNEELDATVIYYGQLTNDTEQLQNIEWPVLGIFGEEDAGIPVASVNSFASALDSLGVKNEMHIYPGVGHAFANPSGSGYAPAETQDAWGKTLAFLDAHLRKAALAAAPAAPAASARTFTLSGKNFRYMMGGEENPTLRVRQGELVRIELDVVEGMHDWVADEFQAATERVRAGNSTFVEFTADKLGTFEYYCSVGSHRQMGMAGKLIVE